MRNSRASVRINSAPRHNRACQPWPWLLLALAFLRPWQQDSAAAETVPADEQLRAEMAKSGRGLFFSGRYDEALAACANRDDAESRMLHAEILVETGRHDEAIRLLAHAGNDPLLLACRGEAYAACGQYDKADADFRAAQADWRDPPLPGQVRAKLARGQMLLALGRRREAEDEVDWFFDFYADCDNNALSAEMAFAIGSAAVIVDSPDNYKEGMKMVALAQRQDRAFLPALVRAGEIFLAKYQYADAEEEFSSALRLNPHHPAANVGMAMLKIQAGDLTAAEAHARQALATDPRHVPAILVLAELEFIDEHLENSLTRCEEALRINPHYPPALLWRAALLYFCDNSEESRKARAAALAAGEVLPFAEEEWRVESRRIMESRLGHLLCQLLNQRYRLAEALAMAREAAQADPENSLAQADLAICLMRQGLEEEAGPILEIARRLDPFNVWVYNLRRLWERRQEYNLFKGERVTVQIHRQDEPALAACAPAWAEEHIQWCERAFGYRVEQPLQIAILKSQADFAARVTGLPRLDATGASFGAFVALVTPRVGRESNRPYNWEITLRHELAHTVTIFASRYRLPRWLGEGLSVYAQQWDDPAYDIPFATMLDRGVLPTFSTWNRSFHRPNEIWETPAAYAAAGTFVRWVAKQYGEATLAKIIAAYGEGKPETEIWEQSTGLTMTALEQELHQQLRLQGEALQPEILENPNNLAAYEKAHAEQPNDAASALRLLRLYRQIRPQQAYAFAERMAGRDLAQTPTKTDSELFFLSAYVAAEKAIRDQQWQEARTMAEMALKTRPNSALARHALGIAHLALGERKEAEACWREAIRLYPRFVHDTPIGNPYGALLRLLEEDKRGEEIVDLLAAYTLIRLDDAAALRRLAEMAAEAGKRDIALLAYRRLMAVDPYERSDHERYGRLLAETNRKEEAEREERIARALGE